MSEINWPYLAKLVKWGIPANAISPRADDFGFSVEQYLHKLYDEFEFFLHELWQSVDLPEPALVQYDIAEWLQKGPSRRGVRGFRGVSKTWITIAYVLWRLYRNVNERVLFVSESIGHSRKSLQLARRWIDNVPFLCQLQPSKVAKHRDSSDQFDVGPSKSDRVASVTAMGITGQLTGGRSSLIVGDDVETHENSITRTQRIMLRERVKEFDSIVLPGGDIVYLGTPHHEETLYDTLGEAGYTFRAWPSEYPGAGDEIPGLAPIYAKRLAAGLAAPGDPIWPERFTREDLYVRRVSEGATTYSMQFLLRSGLGSSDAHPLKLADFIVHPVHVTTAPGTIMWGMSNSKGSTAVESIPSVGYDQDMFYSPVMVDDAFFPYTGTKAFLDPSGGGKSGLAIAIVAQLHSYLFVKHVSSLDGGGTVENMEAIVLLLKKHRATELVVEENYGGNTIAQLIRPYILKHTARPPEDQPDKDPLSFWSCSTDTLHNTGQKELRIIGALEPVLNSHRLVADPAVAANNELMYQLTHVTRQRGSLDRYDELDALASCVALWRSNMDQDAKLLRDRKSSDAYQQRLDHYKNRYHKSERPPRWITV
jgi:hypothetical protein